MTVTALTIIIALWLLLEGAAHLYEKWSKNPPPRYIYVKKPNWFGLQMYLKRTRRKLRVWRQSL